jgi:hypothetical protein
MHKQITRLAVVVAVGAIIVAGCGSAVPMATGSAEPSPAGVTPGGVPTATPAATPASATPASATPVASTTLAPATPSPATPKPSPTEPPPATPAPPTSSPSSSPPPAAGGWIGPDEVSGRGYHSLSLVVDDGGTAHAVGVLNDDVFYLSNASGEWTRERLTSAIRTRAALTVFGNPSIAIDADGTLGVAYVGGSGDPRAAFGPLPDTMYYTTNRGGSWAAPVVVADEFMVAHPSLQLRDGRFHIAYQLGFPFDVLEPSERYPIRYATDADGELSDVRVAEHGTRPILRLAPDGAPHIVFGDAYSLLSDQTELRYATAAAGADGFTVESVAGSSDVSQENPKLDEEVFYAMDVAVDGRPIVTWGDDGSSGPLVHVHRRDGGSWSETVIDLAPLDLGGLPRPLATAMDTTGAAHMIVITAAWVYDDGEDSGAWENQAVYYVTNRGGTLRADLLPAELAWSGSITLDGRDRPHLLFGVPRGYEGETGLWYGIAPAE